MISDVTRQPGKYLCETKQGVTEAGAELSRKLPAGSLILSNSGTVCVPKILKIDGCIHDGFVAFPTLEKTIDLDFAYYWFENVRRTIIDENRQGVTQVNLNTGIVREMHFPLAPRDEQERIVAEIEKQFTRLDAGVASLTRVRIALKRYRASMLKAACEGRLVPTEAELARKENRSYETGEQLLQRILKARREKWSAKGKYREPAGIEPGRLPAIPEGWTLASAEAVCSSVRDGTHDTPRYVSEGVPLITSKNLLSTGLDFNNVKLISRENHAEISKRSGVQPGDILFAMIGTIGNPVVVATSREFSIKNVGLFKSNPDFLSSAYLRYWLMSPQFGGWLTPKQKGTTQNFVPLGLLRSLVVALPPCPEQQRIVAELDRRLSTMEELEATAAASEKRGARLRQSVLQKAFSGGN